MATDNRKRSALPWIAGGLMALLVLPVIGLALLLSTATVGGAADLPSGGTVYLSARGFGGYSVSEGSRQTAIEIGGAQVVFTQHAMTVDGVPFSKFDPSWNEFSLGHDDDGLFLFHGGERIPVAAQQSSSTNELR